MFFRLLQRALFGWLACASLVAPLAASQVKPEASVEQLFRVTRWTAEKGLPQNSIKALLQTRDGYLWVGTLYGLARFDGMKFKIFDHSNTPEMTHDAINDLAEDKTDGSLWIGTGDSLLCYRDHRFVRYGAAVGISNIVGRLSSSRQGGVWFSPRPGQVALVRDGRVRTWEIGADRLESDVQQITEEDTSRLLVRKHYGLYRLDADTSSLTQLRLPGQNWYCHLFFQDADRTLWVSTSDGIWHSNGTNWNRIITTDPTLGPWAVLMYRTANGQLWGNLRDVRSKGLHRLIGDRLQPFTAPEFPTDADVSRMLEDREGNIWIGTTTGLFRLQAQRLKLYSLRDGLRNDDIQAVAEAPDGTIRVSTAEGVSTIRQGKIINLPPPYEHLGWAKAHVFLMDSHNRLWL